MATASCGFVQIVAFRRVSIAHLASMHWLGHRKTLGITLSSGFIMNETLERYATHTAKGAFVVRFKEPELVESELSKQREIELATLFDTTDCSRIVLDFSEVSYLNSTGLSLLITLRRRANDKNRGLELCSLQPQIDEVLSITQFHKLFKIHRDDNAVLA